MLFSQSVSSASIKRCCVTKVPRLSRAPDGRRATKGIVPRSVERFAPRFLFHAISNPTRTFILISACPPDLPNKRPAGRVAAPGAASSGQSQKSPKQARMRGRNPWALSNRSAECGELTSAHPIWHAHSCGHRQGCVVWNAPGGGCRERRTCGDGQDRPLPT